MAKSFQFERVKAKEARDFLSFFKKSISDLFSDHYSLNSINFTVEEDYGPKWLTKQLKKKNKKVYVALFNKEIIGYIMTAKSIAGVGFADWLAVDKPHQKKGVASELLSIWEKDAIEEGAHSLFLWTTRNNLDFYKGRGFSVGGEFPKSWHGVNVYLIYKNLREPKEENFLKSYLKKINKK